MKGLCHKCLTSQIEVNIIEGEIMCRECERKKFAKFARKSIQNEPTPTFNDLKNKFERTF